MLGVLYQKKDEMSGVHVNSDKELGELMLAPSAALTKNESSTEPCMLGSEDHAPHDTWTTEERKIFELMLAFSTAPFDRGFKGLCCFTSNGTLGAVLIRTPPGTEGHPQET